MNPAQLIHPRGGVSALSHVLHTWAEVGYRESSWSGASNRDWRGGRWELYWKISDCAWLGIMKRRGTDWYGPSLTHNPPPRLPLRYHAYSRSGCWFRTWSHTQTSDYVWSPWPGLVNTDLRSPARPLYFPLSKAFPEALFFTSSHFKPVFGSLEFLWQYFLTCFIGGLQRS